MNPDDGDATFLFAHHEGDVSWLDGELEVRASEARFEKGMVYAVATVFRAGAVVNRDRVNLTLRRARKTFLGATMAAGASLPGGLLLAMEQEIRSHGIDEHGKGVGGQGRRIEFEDPEPHPEPVEGAQLLNDVENWIGSYVHLPREDLIAVVLWAVATWFVDVVYFAPPLQLYSATKRTGKTLMLDLLHHLVRRGQRTSGIGATPAVLFRQNERNRPTFLVDEAEKLGGRNADQGLVGLFNAGYRRGATVTRCVEPNFEPREFDAFGFRAFAAIGHLWDTIEDRAIKVTLTRKPKKQAVRRFNGRVVVREAAELARRIARWASDHSDDVRRAEEETPRPEWMDDRACDSWSPLFAVAKVAGGPWLTHALDSARSIARTGEEGDPGEKLLHDIQDVFSELGTPEVLASGDLVAALNQRETSSWGDCRGGAGITPHRLAKLLRPFDVVPRQRRRTSDGEKVRGYWRDNLLPVFERYPRPDPLSEAGQVGPLSNGGEIVSSKSEASGAACPTSERPETPRGGGLSHMSRFGEGVDTGRVEELEVPDLFLPEPSG